MKFVKMFLALIGLAGLYLFVKDNMGKVVVKFLDYSTPEIELFLILIITFVLGMIVASFSSTLKIIKLKRQLKHAGNSPAEQTKESKKDKKSKHKKGDADKVDSATSNTSASSSGSAGGYAASGAAATGAGYTSGSDTASTPNATSSDAGSSNPLSVEEQEETVVDAAVEEDNVSAPEIIEVEDNDRDVKTEADEVIPLPADETKTEEGDRK